MGVRSFLVVASLVTASSSAHAEKISQFDEICIAKEALFCATFPAAYGDYASLVAGIRDPRPAVQRNSQKSMAEARNKHRLSGVTNDALHENCVSFLKGLGDVCVVALDVPTAAEMRDAIRESNDAVLAAWLAALEARSQADESSIAAEATGEN